MRVNVLISGGIPLSCADCRLCVSAARPAWWRAEKNTGSWFSSSLRYCDNAHGDM